MNTSLTHNYAVAAEYPFLLKYSELYQGDDNIAYFIILASILACISLLLICILYIRRSMMTIRGNKVDQLKFRYQYLIYDALVESQTEQGLIAQDLIIDKLKKEIAKGNLQKQVLIDLIIDLKKNFTGDSEKQFMHLYYALNLPAYSLKKLNHYSWDVQAKGIKELTEIKYACPEVQLAIANLVYSKKDIVSQEARIASIRLRKDPLQFLQNLQTPLTEWQQINLHHMLMKFEKNLMPDFTRWLSSSNTSVVVFSLRMIADFEQTHTAQYLLPTLLHKDPEVREETIKTLIQLDTQDLLPQMISASQTCSHPTILRLLEAMQVWGTDNQHSFLETLKTSSSEEIREKVLLMSLQTSPQEPGKLSHVAHRTI